MYGAGVINTGYTFFPFSERFRDHGGRYIDPESMQSTVNSEAGLKALILLSGVATLALKRMEIAR
jgi:hypothetical protein